MQVYASRKNLQQREQVYRGGDRLDRLEYVQAQKAKMGPKLERVLNRSSKKMPSGHFIKSSTDCLEFNEIKKHRDIMENWRQPAEMQWSAAEFIKSMDQTQIYNERLLEESSAKIFEEF